MLCTVTDIRGDYAYVRYDDTGVVSEVAIALLPFGVDVGDQLKFENYEFTRVYENITMPPICTLTVHIGGICHGITFSACSLHSTI